TSIVVGGVVAWGVIGPRLLSAGIAEPGYESLVGWLTWPGVGLMLAATVVSLVEQAPALWRALADLRALAKGGTSRSALGAMALAVLCAALVLVVGAIGFGMGPLAGLLALVVAVPFTALAARSAGETDVAPLGQVGQMTQMVTGPLTGGAPVANIGAASI